MVIMSYANGSVALIVGGVIGKNIRKNLEKLNGVSFFYAYASIPGHVN